MRRLGLVSITGAIVLFSLHGTADSIVVDGKVYTGVTLRESASRYYFTTPDGQAISVGKDQLGAGEVVKGDTPLKLPEQPPEPAPVPVPAPEPVPVAKPELALPLTPEAEPVPTPEPAPVAKPELALPLTPEAEPVAPPAPAPEPTPPAAPAPVPAPEPSPIPVPEVPPAPESAPVAVAVPAAAPEPERVPAVIEETPASFVLEEEPAVLEELTMPAAAALQAGAAYALLGAPNDLIEANAVVLKSGNSVVAFVALDLAAVDRSFVARVAENLDEEGSLLTGDKLVVACTGRYTPVQPGLLEGPLNQAVFGDFDATHRAKLADRVAQAVRQAESALQPAKLTMGEGEVPELLTSRLGTDATVDATLGVVCISGASGEALAYMVNYGLCAPVEYGVQPQPGRGVLGALARELRARAGRDVPVLFFNGAAGDVLIDLSAGEDQVGQLLAKRALEALDGVPPEGKVALGCVARVVRAPATLLTGLAPEETVVHEVRLDQNVFLTVPGAAAAQIGLLLRVKAMSQGLEQVFVVTGASDYLGYLPTATEFFAATRESEMTPFGPLVGVWCAEQVLPAGDTAPPVWRELPELARYEAAFSGAIELGRAERGNIRVKWEQTSDGLGVLANVARTVAPAPEEFQSLMGRLGEEQATVLARKLATDFLRTEFMDFSTEERVRLMGIAEGADVPFDAVLLLQFLSDRNALPEQAAGIMEMIETQGHDLSGLRLL